MSKNGAQGYYFEDLEVGMSESFSKVISEDDVIAFAGISGDHNPVHLDADYAAGTMFKERIAHGILTASLISAVLGTKLPGPGSIYLSQTLNFKAPVKLGDEVVATATIKELVEGRGRAVFACDCSVGGKTVLEGEAVLMAPRRPA
jgi:3-hydroxybutyryl-CoA dehydratase